MNRKEAIALLSELGTKGYVRPNFVSIEQRKPDNYQLTLKGDYDRELIEKFTKKKNFVLEENKDKGYLIIFKP